MSDDSIKLYLDGKDVTFTDLVLASRYLSEIVEGLVADADPNVDVEWILSGLDVASLTICGRGRADTDAGRNAVRDVHERWEQVAEDANENNLGNYPAPVRHGVYGLRNMLNGRISAFHMSRSENEPGVRVVPTEDVAAPVSVDSLNRESHGVLRGLVVGIGQQKRLTVSVEVPVWRSIVVCHLPSDMKDGLGKYWNHYISVRGIITREENTGRPITIKQIRDGIKVLDTPDPHDVVRAAGIAPWLSEGFSTDNSGDWWDG